MFRPAGGPPGEGRAHLVAVIRLVGNMAIGQRAKATVHQVSSGQASRFVFVADHLRKSKARHHASRNIHHRYSQSPQRGCLRAVRNPGDHAVSLPMWRQPTMFADPRGCNNSCQWGCSRGRATPWMTRLLNVTEVSINSAMR